MVSLFFGTPCAKIGIVTLISFRHFMRNYYTITLRLTKAQKRRNVLSENNVDSRGGTRAGKDVPPMLLFIYITNRVATVSPILQKMAERGIHGATMVDCEGMLQTLAADSIEPPPFFGSLRKFINPDHEPGKMLFAVLREEQIGVAKSCIHDVCGSLDRPNAGIMFTVPVTSVEGVE